MFSVAIHDSHNSGPPLTNLLWGELEIDSGLRCDRVHRKYFSDHIVIRRRDVSCNLQTADLAAIRIRGQRASRCNRHSTSVVPGKYVRSTVRRVAAGAAHRDRVGGRSQTGGYATAKPG